MKNKAPLMLMEIMILMLAFAFSTALCIKAFVKSDEISRRSEARDNAVIIVENVAERLRNNGGDLAKTAMELDADLNGNTIVINYDKYTHKTDNVSEYQMKAELCPAKMKGMGEARISVSDKKSDELFSISVMWQEAVE